MHLVYRTSWDKHNDPRATHETSMSVEQLSQSLNCIERRYKEYDADGNSETFCEDLLEVLLEMRHYVGVCLLPNQEVFLSLMEHLDDFARTYARKRYPR